MLIILLNQIDKMDGLVGVMTAAFGEGAEPKALTKSARLKSEKELRSQGEKRKEGQPWQGLCVCFMPSFWQ